MIHIENLNPLHCLRVIVIHLWLKSYAVLVFRFRVAEERSSQWRFQSRMPFKIQKVANLEKRSTYLVVFLGPSELWAKFIRLVFALMKDDQWRCSPTLSLAHTPSPMHPPASLLCESPTAETVFSMSVSGWTSCRYSKNRALWTPALSSTQSSTLIIHSLQRKLLSFLFTWLHFPSC